MATVFDVAQYILELKKQLSTIKLQKLVYYAQAWHLVWEDTPLFNSRIEAWPNGPVCPDLYNAHKGKFFVDPSLAIGNSANLLQQEKQSIESILKAYGDKRAEYLIHLTHAEDPWINARKRASAYPGDKCKEEITLSDMAEYYTGIVDG